MANKVYAILVIVLAIFGSGLASIVHGETFECAFIQEKYSSGKPNKASCSMLPEKIYSTKWHTPRKNEHCDVEAVYSFEDLTDVVVDTNKKSVFWTRHHGLTEDAKPKQKAYYLKQGLNEQETEEKVNIEETIKESFMIITHHKSNTRIYTDEVTGKLLNPPKEVPEHNLILTNNNYLFYLYIPEASGHSILLEPTGKADSSWVGIRFGKCRKIQ